MVQEQDKDLETIATNSLGLGEDSVKLYTETLSLKNAFAQTNQSTIVAREASSASVVHIERLHISMTDTVKDMTALVERSKQIDGMVSVIQAIAEQTNLLALNAAIEQHEQENRDVASRSLQTKLERLRVAHRPQREKFRAL